MAERIHHAALPQPVGLIGDREHLACTCRHGTRLRHVGVVNVERDTDGRRAHGFRTRRAEVGCLGGHANALPLDQKYSYLRPIRRDDPLSFFYGTERLRIKRHCRVYVPDGEKRIDLGHAPSLTGRSGHDPAPLSGDIRGRWASRRR